jgi:DNA-binding FadR family transcriptional regulator
VVAIIDHVRVPKAGELVASQLRRQIVRGELSEGDALPSEAVLMERFGVSRPTLREAFRILEAENLISVRRGARGGARVHVPDVSAAARYAGAILQFRRATLEDVFDTRTLLESQAAELLAGKRKRADFELFEQLLAAEEATIEENEDEFLEADEAFHLAIVERAGNETLDLLVRMIYAIIETATASATRVHRADAADALNWRRRTHRSHVKFVEILREGKPADVEAYWRRHLQSISKVLREDLPAETVLDLMS